MYENSKADIRSEIHFKSSCSSAKIGSAQVSFL